MTSGVCPYCGGDPSKQKMLSDPDDHGNLNRRTCCEHWSDDEAARARYESRDSSSGALEDVMRAGLDFLGRLFR
jgi:hypothetical protein